MKSIMRKSREGDLVYTSLLFWCPGCERIDDKGERHAGLHRLAVNSPQKNPQWDWDGNLEQPTLSPSILSQQEGFVCHSYLKAGVFEFLSDSTHRYSGQKVPIPDLPDWVVGL